jgi:UDP-MurNAc hydroxylase
MSTTLHAAPGPIIKFYGHACFAVMNGDTSVVTDPWFSAQGAFLGSWAQFPDNSHVPCDLVRESAFIVLSHDHQDHFDLNFLRTVSADTVIVVPNYHHSRLRDTLRRELPNRVFTVDDRQPIELGNDIVLIPVLQPIPVWDDCALLFRVGGRTIVNLNDAKLPAADLNWIARNFRVDYLLLQYSGANWHPHAYQYSAEESAAIARRKIETKFRAVAHVVEALDPGCVVPCAGPACFLDDDLFELNFSQDSIFPTQREFMEFAADAGFADRVAVLLPGDELGPSTDSQTLTIANLAAPPFADRDSYLEAYRRRRLPAIQDELARIQQPDGPLLEKCREYFTPLVQSTPYLSERIGGAVLLELTGPGLERIVIDFTRPEDPVRPFVGEDWFYRLRTEARFVNEILSGRLTWEELLLSMRFGATRVPDLYNEYLIVFLRYADPQQYALFEQYERRGERNSESFVLQHNGRELCIQRVCPHAGGDLSKGRVEGDELLCPVHGWRFSLVDGTCARTNHSIMVEEITPADQTSVIVS